jgi:FAD/FMN-containing dehydrogenase
MANEQLLPRLTEIVGAKGVICTEDAMQPYMNSWRDNWHGRALAVVRPRSAIETASVVKLCVEMQTPIVPQGGRTGVTGASQPHDDASEIVVSMERMNTIRAVDVENDTITVDAGCILADVRQAAKDVNRLFPLFFGAVGSCLIGGNISTNAGGINVIRYGNTRGLVCGLEVVLPDGEIWDGLRGLRKDNAGYDLKQIFIGAEGTLGIVTGAVLRLFPRPATELTAFFAVPSPAAAVAWLTRVKGAFAEQLTSFELIQRRCIDVTVNRITGTSNPLSGDAPWYVLLELSSQIAGSHLQESLEAAFEHGLAAQEISDGIIASSGQRAEALWRMRESIPEAHKAEGKSFKHDISVPISSIPEFLAQAEAALNEAFPGCAMFTFGHLGDGNLHFNPLAPKGTGDPEDLQRVNRIVHDLVTAFGGSISAEHGVGRLRREELAHYKSPIEMKLMRALKQTFDPLNLLNPGKVFPRQASR